MQDQNKEKDLSNVSVFIQELIEENKQLKINIMMGEEGDQENQIQIYNLEERVKELQTHVLYLEDHNKILQDELDYYYYYAHPESSPYVSPFSSPDTICEDYIY